jgi:hypothetical protein
MQNRRSIRVGLKVIHRHFVGGHRLRRVSELVYMRGAPSAVLGWIDVGGLRTPLTIALDPAKLRRGGIKDTWYYDGATADPRFEDMKPLPGSETRGAG